jgi:hypothetical protein
MRTRLVASYSAPELALGVGIWAPVVDNVRFLPKFTFGLGSFATPNAPSGGGGSEGHMFVMLGLTGMYNRDF